MPLHGGRVPAWLATRMASLGRVLVEALLLHYGRDELLRRLAHPFWFQSLGCVMGMDWHSSGITTSVLGALKRGLGPVEHELGLHVCGGRGRHSRKTPDELRALGERIGFDGEALAHTSKLVAKVDSAAVQDGYQLYLHGFIVGDDGKWVVVQQGMRPEAGTARRYHWLSEGVRDFVDEPHHAIDSLGGPAHGLIVNLTDRRADSSRKAQLELVARGPDAVLPHLTMPRHHDVRPSDVLLRRMRGTIAAAAERAPIDFADLLMTPGLGARTVEALAAVAEVVHGAPCRFTDPARFALAHGGKDGHPFPVPLRVYDQTIAVMRRAVDAARLGNDERLAAIRRLDAEARRMESIAESPTFADYVAENVARSDEWHGRTAADDRKPRKQLELFTPKTTADRPAAPAPTR
ncbi:MAG: hypothetical protein JWM53_1089, partial [bacterium]|nr:hypothetical protein [bacterium]